VRGEQTEHRYDNQHNEQDQTHNQKQVDHHAQNKPQQKTNERPDNGSNDQGTSQVVGNDQAKRGEQQDGPQQHVAMPPPHRRISIP
jgi:hypothetical protein